MIKLFRTKDTKDCFKRVFEPSGKIQALLHNVGVHVGIFWRGSPFVKNALSILNLLCFD
jgi:hypothetical protein